MKLTAGTYHFRKHYSCWGIWQCELASDKHISSRFVKDCFTFEDAVRETYRLNGWGEPKKIHKSF